jgi:dihydropteroate synthase
MISPAPIHLWQLPQRQLTIGSRPLIMGIVNATPDSFSDGGLYNVPDRAVAHALELVEQGADILDIGGESTRPGAEPVSVDEERRRVEPVVRALAGRVTVPLSLDTSKAEVARAGLDLGAEIINDVTALTGDAAMTEVARASRAGLVLMHMQGTPRTMQINPHYANVVADVTHYLRQRVDELAALSIDPAHVAIDPGIGFGKTTDHNLELLARLAEFQSLSRPVCLGVSRKGLLGKILNRTVEQRIHGSLAVLCHAMSRRAVQIIRVHDVAATRDVIAMWQAIERKAEDLRTT